MTIDDTSSPEPGPDASIADIQADIDTTRKELGDTVEALAAKVDVKARAKQKAGETKDRVTETVDHGRQIAVDKAQTAQFAVRGALTDDAGSVKPVVPRAALIAAGVVVIGIVVWWRRR